MAPAIEYSRGVEDAWAKVAAFVPELLAFLVVFVIGYVVAKLISKIADRLLERAGFDRALDRGGVRKAIAATSYDPSDLVSKLIFLTLMLLVLQLSFGVFGTARSAS